MNLNRLEINIYNIYNIYMPTAYCMSCRRRVDVKNAKLHDGKRISGVCHDCGRKVSAFIKKTQKHMK